MTINCKGTLIDLNHPRIMGILNVTPDSFFDGGKYNSKKLLLQQAEKMLNQGATFIDVGAYSSRPNADFVSEEDELYRIIPIVESLLKEFPDILISIDTFRSKVAKHCIEAGAAIINDISAGHLDSNMLETVSHLDVPYIMMHMKGTPQNMQELTTYDNLLKDIILYFSERISQAKAKGIHDIIVDPGFGFAKTLEQNYDLLENLNLLNLLERPILVGISRKSMIYKLLNTSPEHALNGTTILNTVALQKGSNILRVHDVKEAMECVKLISEINNR